MTERNPSIPCLNKCFRNPALDDASPPEVTRWLFQKCLTEALHLLLEAEIAAFLAHHPQSTVQPPNRGNMRNGYYTRKLKTKFGTLQVNIPRDRAGDFKQQTIPFYCRSAFSVEDILLPLMRDSLSLPDLQNHIQQHYGNTYPPCCLNHMSRFLAQKISFFRNKPIPATHNLLCFGSIPLCAAGDCVCHAGSASCCFIISVSEKQKATLLDCRFDDCSICALLAQMMVQLRERGLTHVDFLYAEKNTMPYLPAFFPRHRLTLHENFARLERTDTRPTA